jgi:PAS domain S-box-containing protein
MMHKDEPPVAGKASSVVTEVFVGGSGMARQMRSFDWASSPIGDPARWPVALRSTVTLLLGSRFPMFIAWGDELTLLYNDAYSSVLGAKHPEALGRSFQYVWSEIWPDIAPLIDQALAGEAVWLEDLPLRMNRHGYGEDTTFTFSYSPARNDVGEIVGMFCACTETTRQTQAENELRQREARLLFFGDLEERLFLSTEATDAMRAATEMLGLSLGASRCAYADVAADSDSFCIRSDFTAPGIASSTGDYNLDLFGPRAAAEMRAGETLVVHDVPAELAPAEGREMFQAIGIDAIICCPLIKDGRLAAMMAVHQDQPRTWTAGEIALVKEVVERCWAHVERVGAEARLRESEERLRLAVDNADVGFWDVDLIQDTLIWPPRTKAMFGISPDVPVTMQDFFEGLHPDDREATSAAYAAAADPEQRALYDVHYRTLGKEDGIVRWVEAKGRGIFDAQRRCVRVAGTAVQITARKEAEEALRELNATLEARIATAVAEREEVLEALRHSQKMEAMGQLTGGVAHDFNNLLTPIVGSLDLLQRKGLGGEREQRLIAGAAQSAERARTLVQRLLAFARRQPLQPVPVDVAKLVSGMGELVSSTIGPQIRVVVEAPDGLPSALADPNQLEMAVLNLAVNARDAMPDGGTLRITAGRESIRSDHRSKLRTGHYIRLSVADTGAGMDAATLARAVEPFFSANSD